MTVCWFQQKCTNLFAHQNHVHLWRKTTSVASFPLNSTTVITLNVLQTWPRRNGVTSGGILGVFQKVVIVVPNILAIEAVGWAFTLIIFPGEWICLKNNCLLINFTQKKNTFFPDILKWEIKTDKSTSSVVNFL